MSAPEDEFAFQLKAAGVAGWVREHKFDTPPIEHALCAGTGEVFNVKTRKPRKCSPCKGTGEWKRKWRFDFAWLNEMVAVEIEGGVFTGGRHTRGVAFTQDCVKYNTAACSGWTVIRVTPEHVKSGEALTWTETLILKS